MSTQELIVYLNDKFGPTSQTSIAIYDAGNCSRRCRRRDAPNLPSSSVSPG